jgi:hypothetical protein
MLLLLALSAQLSAYAQQLYAQPSFVGGNGVFSGAGTSAPNFPAYASGYAPIVRPVAPQFARPVVPLADTSRFDLRQADRAVRSAQIGAQANNLFYTTSWATTFPNADPGTTSLLSSGLGRFSLTAKAASAQRNEYRLQDEIDHYRATHPEMTREDREVLDDLVLEREASRNDKIRRVVSLVPNLVVSGTGAPISAFFERRSNDNSYSLAKNALYDARQDFKPGDEDSVRSLRNARDDVEQADQRRDANTYDLLGTSFNGAAKLGPIFRKKASQTKIETGYRNLRAARQDFAEDPSEDNRLALQIANVFVRASEEEDEYNKDDLVTSALFPAASMRTRILASIASGKNNQDESHLWLRYSRLKRQQLLRKQAKGVQSETDPVAQRMLGLSIYGPAIGNK